MGDFALDQITTPESTNWIEILWHFNGQQAIYTLFLISINFMAKSRDIAHNWVQQKS